MSCAKLLVYQSCVVWILLITEQVLLTIYPISFDGTLQYHHHCNVAVLICTCQSFKYLKDKLEKLQNAVRYKPPS